MAYDLTSFSFLKIYILFFPLNFRDYRLVLYEPRVKFIFWSKDSDFEVVSDSHAENACGLVKNSNGKWFPFLVVQVVKAVDALHLEFRGVDNLVACNTTRVLRAFQNARVGSHVSLPFDLDNLFASML